jgi:Xaa-Pro aminopeptidase
LLIAALGPQLAAQSVPPAATPIEDLPGAGRPVALEAHRLRRAALLERVPSGVVVIPAAARRGSDDRVLQDSDFRQDDYFFYLTGVETPDAWLLLTKSVEGPQTILYLPVADPAREQWTGHMLAPGETAAKLTGIADVRPLDATDLESAIEGAILENPGPVYTLLLRGRSDNAPVQQWVRSGWELRSITPVLDSMRVVKDEGELEALRRAIAITVEAHRAAMRAAHPGMYEYQLEATIEYTFRSHGADRVGFPSIVGSGPNSTILHYDVNRRQMGDGDLLVVDIGAEYAQYTGDVTRTFPVNGRFTARQKAIYDLVLAANQAVIDAVRPGMTIRELGILARQYMQANSGTLCGEGGCTRYFIHGLSHWLGMRVHDVGDYAMPLEPGMVLTVEPGIYIPEEELGVRIEDDVLVTTDGCEVLSVGAPKSTDEIERLMRQGAGSGGARRHQ